MACWTFVMGDVICGIINTDVFLFVWISGRRAKHKTEHKVMVQVDALSRRLDANPANLKINHVDCQFCIFLCYYNDWHAGTMEGPEWDAQTHGTLHSVIGAEATDISGGGGEGGHHQGFQRLWAPPGDGDLLQISGAGDLGDGQQLDIGGEELGMGEEGLE